MIRLRGLAAPVCLSVGVFGFSFLIAYRVQSQPPASFKPPKPFIAYARVLHFRGAERPPIVRQEMFARRSDGSYVRSFDSVSPAGESGWSVTIFDLRNRKKVFLDPFTKTSTTFLYHSDEEVLDNFRTLGTCSSLGLVGAALTSGHRVWDNLLGRRVTQLVQELKGDRVEKWVAPELDCYPLRRNEFSSRGPLNEFTVTKVEEVEPPDKMFEIPLGYVEASPLQVEALYAAKYPGHSFHGSEKVAGLVEERYRKSRNR